MTPPSPQSPGRYAQHEPIRRDDPDELTSQTLAALAALPHADRQHLITKLTLRQSSVPPPKSFSWGQAVVSIVAAVVLAVAAAGVSIFRNDAVGQEHQKTTDNRISIVESAVNEHRATGTHTSTETALARIEAKVDQQSQRLERIERQLDQQRRPR